MIERLNRTYKASYRKTNGFDNIDGANYDLALWVAYYNFLRPHKHNNYKVLNEVEIVLTADAGQMAASHLRSTDDSEPATRRPLTVLRFRPGYHQP